MNVIFVDSNKEVSLYTTDKLNEDEIIFIVNECLLNTIHKVISIFQSKSYCNYYLNDNNTIIEDCIQGG